MRYLILACVIIASATSAWADPPPGKGKDGFSISNLALMDSDPNGSKEVGTVIAIIDKDFVLTLVKFMDSQDIERNIVLKAGEAGFQPGVGGTGFGSGAIFFELNNCLGTVYFSAIMGLQPTFDPSAAVRAPIFGPPPFDELYLYTSADDQPIVATINSSSDGSGGCGNTPSPETFGGLVPLELLDSDLHFTFPPPFRLVTK